MTRSPPDARTENAVLPVVTLVVGLLSVCLPPLLLVAVILGIVCLSRSSRPEYLARRGFVIAGLLVPLVIVPVEVVLAAIAVPNFTRFNVRAKQSECRTNLKALYTAERVWFLDHDVYSTSPAEVGFVPERHNRYLYRLAPTGPLSDRTKRTDDMTGTVGFGVDEFYFGSKTPTAMVDAAIPPALRATLGVQGTCPTCEFTAVCAGNLDTDATIDVWSVSSRARTSPDGEPIPPGTPFNDVNDTVK